MAGPDDLAKTMLEMVEMIAPVREAMKGFRTQLINDGWSPESADMIAANMFVGLTQKMFSV
jgi:triphosphoribosyl-dephospho-CoA synthetase